MNERYTRQTHVVGQEVLESLMRSSVLIYGMGGVGSEIAKNLVLMGIKRITLQDSRCAHVADLGVNAFLSSSDATERCNRATASAKLLRQINSDTDIQTRTTGIGNETDLNYLNAYQCVILTDTLLSVQARVNNYCRSQHPPIKFIAADVIGVVGTAFNDFGEKHVVHGVDDESREIFIGDITVSQGKILITTAENQKHHFESGDNVEVNCVTGLEDLNGVVSSVTVCTPYQFELSTCEISKLKGSYIRGGVCQKLTKPRIVHFEPLEKQLWKPDILTLDSTERLKSLSIHLAILTLYKFRELKNAVSIQNLDSFLSLAQKLSMENGYSYIDADKSILRSVFLTSEGQLQPLAALVGGAVAHETLKALSGKYMPCKQFSIWDALQLVVNDSDKTGRFSLEEDDYLLLEKCTGTDLSKMLADSNIFLAGCSAIGCEILKNMALIGVATEKGKIRIADGNFVRKPNLGSQFLFRSQDIGLPKCLSASKWVKSVKPGINLECFPCYVRPETSPLSDNVLKELDVVISSLDSVDARRYIDKRCVQSACSLIDVGMEGNKGHVQVIVPHLTESYTSMADPDLSEKYPYCTIASFPYKIEHSIQWACERFEVMFKEKPLHFNQFWKQQVSPTEVLKRLESGQTVEGMRKVALIMKKRPKSWKDCVHLARLKFEKYFCFKALQLLHVMPADLHDEKGLLFWRSLKRPPTPIQFSWQNPLHHSFIISLSKLLASVWGIVYTPDEACPEMISSILSILVVPKFSPDNNKKPDIEEPNGSKLHVQEQEDDFEYCIAVFKEHTCDPVVPANPLCLDVTSDNCCHLDFVTAAANLRATMYGIPTISKQKVQLMVGQMVPAIATTTSVIGALATIEVMKIVRKMNNVRYYRNSFVNLSDPCYIFAEPKEPERIELQNGKCFTMWDYFEVQGKPDMVLEEFLALLMEKTGLNPSMVVCGTRMLWVSILPSHAKRKASTMVDLVGPETLQRYTELTVAFETPAGEEIIGPPIRYVF